MGLEVKGLNEIIQDVNNLAVLTRDENVTNEALNRGANIIYEAAKANANNGVIRVRTGTLLSSIRKSGVRRRRDNEKAVTIGVRRSSRAFYANPVEYGHGGPRPAPPHPFIRPAYDQNAEAAYEEMKSVIVKALSGR